MSRPSNPPTPGAYARLRTLAAAPLLGLPGHIGDEAAAGASACWSANGRALGALVIGTVSSEANAQIARDPGYAHVIVGAALRAGAGAGGVKGRRMRGSAA